jgi:predicted transcriptional regulator
MTTSLPPTRDQVLELIANDPAISQTEIARLVGVSQQRVSQILLEAGYRQRWVRKEEP